MLSDTPEYRKAQKQHIKATKNRSATVDQDWTQFRASEKKFKSRFPPPNLSNVLDLHSEEPGHWVGSPTAFDYVNVSRFDKKAVALQLSPGLVILPGFLTHKEQKDLIRWSLSKHARSPNETNMDTHYILPEEGLWNAHLEVRNDNGPPALIQPKAPISSSSEDQTPSGPRQLINNTPASTENFEAISSTPKPPATPSPSVQPDSPSSLVYKLRWANIGWYYHWGTKQYDFSRGPGVIDSELRSVCKNAVSSVDWGMVHGAQDPGWEPDGPDWHTWDESYEPDAGIVNFYQEKDTLMAHVDRSELCATSPLVSISLGNAAIFLIGGQTRQVEPVPILLRSGDIVIMSGPVCRRAYHGVPRILEGSLPSHLSLDDQHSEWEPYGQYMRTTRININVRQVFPKGFNTVK